MIKLLRNHLLQHIIILLIFVFFYEVLNSSYRNLHVTIFDQFASVFAHDRLDNDRSLKFTFVEIDEDIYKQWGALPLTPRDKLVELLETLGERAEKARAIIVNIDTSYCHAALSKLGDVQCQDDDYEWFDLALRDWARTYQGAPPIILSRLLEQRLQVETGIRLAPQSSILDDIIVDLGLERRKDGSEPDLSHGLHWAAPSFKASNQDGIIRNWSLWQDVCHDGKPIVMPSVQLLTLLAFSDERSSVVADVVDRLNENRPENCDEEPSSLSEPVIALDGGRELDLGKGWQAQKIFYSIPWNNSSEASSSTAMEFHGDSWLMRPVPEAVEQSTNVAA